MVKRRERPTFGSRRGLRLKPRRLSFSPVFYVKVVAYVCMATSCFLLLSYWFATRLANTSYIVVFSFLVLVLLSNLLSRKCAQLLRRYGHQ